MRDERGLSNSITSVLLFPLALGMLFLGMQWTMVTWATAIAQGAAQDGARTASIYGSGPTAGEAAAHAALNPSVISEVSVTVSSDATTSTATVRGEAVRVVPGYPTTVEVTATVPRERLTQP